MHMLTIEILRKLSKDSNTSMEIPPDVVPETSEPTTEVSPIMFKDLNATVPNSSEAGSETLGYAAEILPS